MINASFTGHRVIKTNLNLLKNDMYTKLERAIINGGLLNYYCGGALGFDMHAAKTIIQLRKKHPLITLNLILPCSFEEQSYKWTDNDKKVYYDIINQSNSIEYISDHYYDGCMKDRNIRLIDLADFCFCYYDSHKYRSGTGQTVRLAKKKQIGIWNFFK